MTTVEHPWLPKTSCTECCVQAGLGTRANRAVEAARAARRVASAVAVLLATPLLALPLPGHATIKRQLCRALLGCLGIKIAVTGDPIRRLRGLLIVSNHQSWADVVAIAAIMPGTFVARADVFDWPGVGLAARVARVIPIDRRSLRTLPGVVDDVFHRLSTGETVVAFPEGTTYCGRDNGSFRPALFQAAVDSARPVQPIRISYRHDDGSHSTATTFLGEDSLWASLTRTVRTRRTIAHVDVLPLQLPGNGRRELATRCEGAVLSRTPGLSKTPWPV